MNAMVDKAVKLIGEPTLKRTLIISVILFVLIIAYTCICGKWGDVYHYFVQSGYVLEGFVPYKDFVFEYPPMSMFFMLIPRIFTSNYDTYCFLHAAFSVAFFAIGLLYLYKIAEKHALSKKRMAIIVLGVILFANYFLVARNDVFPTVICIMAIYYFLEKRYTLVWILLAIGTMTKLYPSVLALGLVAYMIGNREYRNALMGVGIVAAVCLLISLPFIILDPSTAFAYLTYHSDRGLQVESVASSIIMVINIFIPGIITVEFNYGSDNIVGPIPDAIASVANMALAAAFMIFIIAVIIHMRKDQKEGKETADPKLAVLICVAMLMLFITFCKVFSAQYIIWTMMLMIFAQFACFDTKSRDQMLAVMVVYGLMSAFNGYYTYFNMIDLEATGVIVIFIRNIAQIILTLLVLKMIYLRLKNGPETTTSEEVEAHPTD